MLIRRYIRLSMATRRDWYQMWTSFVFFYIVGLLEDMDHWLHVGLAYLCWHYLIVLYLVCSAIRSSDHKLPLNLLTRSRCIWNHITARVKPTFVEWHRAPVDENDDADICDLSDVSDVDLQQHKLTHHHHHHHHHHIIICMKIGQTFFAEDQAQFSNVFQGKTMETSSWWYDHPTPSVIEASPYLEPQLAHSHITTVVFSTAA